MIAIVLCSAYQLKTLLQLDACADLCCVCVACKLLILTVRRVHFSEEWNELQHLMIMEVSNYV
jgi:hypothetical protein